MGAFRSKWQQASIQTSRAIRHHIVVDLVPVAVKYSVHSGLSAEEARCVRASSPQAGSTTGERSLHLSLHSSHHASFGYAFPSTQLCSIHGGRQGRIRSLVRISALHLYPSVRLLFISFS